GPFFMEDFSRAEFVFGEQRRIERNLVPIGQRPTCFNAEVAVRYVTLGKLDLVLYCYAEPIGQAYFYLLSQEVISWSMRIEVSFVDQPCEHTTSRKHIGIGERRKTAAGKSTWCTISTRQFIAHDHDPRFDGRSRLRCRRCGFGFLFRGGRLGGVDVYSRRNALPRRSRRRLIGVNRILREQARSDAERGERGYAKAERGFADHARNLQKRPD